MSATEWDRVFLAVTDTFWPEFFHGELNSEDLDKAAAVADLVTKNGAVSSDGSLTATSEPDRACLLIDRDDDIWRYSLDTAKWECQTDSASLAWEHITRYCSPVRVFTPQTDDGAGAPPATGGGLAGEATSTPAPSSPRSFELLRHIDVTGKSGTGVVAEGVQFTDGTAALRWRGANPATAVWPNVEEILAVHGHEGATELVWLDPPWSPFDLAAEASKRIDSIVLGSGDEPESTATADNSDSPTGEG